MNYREADVFDMTLRKFFLLFDEYLEANGLKEKEITIDQVF